jgi:regulator of ribosome biosynthesis
MNDEGVGAKPVRRWCGRANGRDFGDTCRWDNISPRSRYQKSLCISASEQLFFLPNFNLVPHSQTFPTTIKMADLDSSDIAMPISPSEQIANEISDSTARPSVTITKPIPYTFDLGHLLINDANPIQPNPSEQHLVSNGRDCAQALINQLLLTCPIASTPDGVHISLPAPIFILPREKTIPKDKEPTKWERFAKKKGIKAKKREGKLVYDEAKGEWLPKYGYRGANKAGENDWLVEVDAAKEKRTGQAGDLRKEKRTERKERVKRQERKTRANEAKSKKGT